MSNDPFWAAVNAQLAELKSAKTAADVLRILAHDRDPYFTVLGDTAGHGPGRPADSGFFAGGGGDGDVWESLHEAGWSQVWSRAGYFWCMQAPDGSQITYIEGDIYEGNRKPV